MLQPKKHKYRKAFKGRIMRDAWVSQCAKLAARDGAARKPG